MNLKIVAIIFLLVISFRISGQNESEINKTDDQGRKQGHWIKKYPNTIVMYDGIFKDNHPVGEFKRFYESSALKSVLIYSADGKEAIATLYHENGYLSSKGTYINQLKEGKWQFFSEFIKGYNVSEEFYTRNIKNGPALKFYPDSTVAERLTYKNDILEGQCIQYYPNGSVSMKSNYTNGKFNGRFEVWFPNGQIEFSGQYKNDVKDGQWLIYKNDSTVKYKITYIDGVTKDRQMDIDQSDYLDSLEKNKGKIADPEKSGVMW
jgi:antitoxin component YwqK of YwqJK toxin-antitoxin module